MEQLNMKTILDEMGRIGQKRVAGFYSEEFLADLKGRKGVEVFKEMTSNDDVVGAVSYVVELMGRQAKWDVEAGGKKTDADKKAAEFIKSCMDDMQNTWTDTISEIMTFLDFGWSYHEICYKYRRGQSKDPKFNSKYDDGLIGWRKLPIRAQDTLWEWLVDPEDNLQGLRQLAPPSYGIYDIPIEKALHFRTTLNKDNPEGRSIWRRAYRSWYFKKRIQEIEGIGIERDLAGLPFIQPPNTVEIFDDTDPDMVKLLQQARDIIKNVRRDSTEGVVLPFGWTFSLLSTGGRRQFDTSAIIERYDSRIAMTALADFILMGHQKVGSYSLSSNKTDMFGVAMGAFLDIICQVFNNQGIPKLIDLNANAFKGITGYPKLTHGEIQAPDLNDLGNYIKNLTGVGVIVPGPELEKFSREIADIPLEADDFVPMGVPNEPSPATGTANEEEEASSIPGKTDDQKVGVEPIIESKKSIRKSLFGKHIKYD